jgi:asparagine synthase (glutamine-hydrolysing)
MTDPLRRLMFADQADYLTDDILVKVDRAAMAASLETRVPLLDPRIAEFSWRLPNHYLHTPGEGKRVLREVLYRHIPRAMVERPKQGFAPPMSAWLRGPLREWATHLLSPASLRELPMLDLPEVASLWNRHQSGRIDASYALWNVLMLAAWRERMGAIV